MNILITGGAGFIGSALIRYLIHQTQHKVLNIDKLTYAANLDALNTVHHHPHYYFSQTDICAKDSLQQLFTEFKPDAVIHLAAESHVDRSLAQADAFIQTNIIGTYQLLEAAYQYWHLLTAYKQQSFRFLHVSTDEVYGDAVLSDKPFSEQSPYLPSSPYSASKASSDHLVHAWQRSYGLPTLITHCSNNYGPYQYPEKLIPLTILNALAGKQLPIYGNGLQIRDWLYVDDHVQALYKVLIQGKSGETYNISSNHPYTNINVVQSICNLLDELRPQKPNNIQHYHDLINFVSDRPGHDVRYDIDSSKIRYHIGWKPQETFTSGLAKTVDWYLKYLHI